MNIKEAYAIISSKFNKSRIDKCLEYSSLFVFELGSNDKDNASKQIGNLYSVNKETGEVKYFIPTELSMEEYKAGKEITDFKSNNDMSHGDIGKAFISELLDDELAHYGVLGMKWGIRKAERKGETYTYKSYGQKKWEKKLDKRVKKDAKPEKIKNAQEKLDLFKTRDQNRQEYARKASLGKSFIKQITMGPMGSGAYSRWRSAGDSRAMAFIKSNAIMNTFAWPITVAVSRGAEFKTARNINQARKQR